MSRPRSLRTRLFRALMLMTLLTLGLMTLLSAVMDLKLFRDQLLRDLRVLTEVVGENSVSALVFDSPESAADNLATLAREYQLRAATLYNAEGRPFAHWQRDADVLPGAPRVVLIHNLTFDGRPIGRLEVEVVLAELVRQARLYTLLVGALTLGTLVLALLLALYLQRYIARSLLTLVEATRRVADEGNYALRVPSLGLEREIESLVNGFNAMLAQIEARETALARANARLRRLALDLTMLDEVARARLATELHDSPMQKLAVAQLQLVAARDDPEDPDMPARLGLGTDLLREALGELRTLQFDLSPPVLAQQGLGAALVWLAESTQARFGIALRTAIPEDLPALPRETAILLFQCARELVYNIIKHARARSGGIALSVADGQLCLRVEDAGAGLGAHPDGPVPAGGGGFGLYSVRERLRLLGGTLHLDSTATGGARATVLVPLPQPSTPSR